MHPPRLFAFLLAALLLPLLTLSGCAGPTFIVQQYKGPPRSQESIAVFRVNGSDAARLLELDGEDVAAPLDVDSRLHIELLPGPHTVTMGNANAPNERLAPVSFRAEPGKVYRAVIESGARVHEVSRGSDAVGVDVTSAARD